jgi:hypothetical protein
LKKDGGVEHRQKSLMKIFRWQKAAAVYLKGEQKK